MSDLLDHAADLLLGSRCPGCDRPGRGLCRGCRAELDAGRIRFARREPSPPGYPLTVCAGDYAGVLPALIAGFKDERLMGLAGPLAARLTGSVAHLLAALGRVGVAYALVPVPSPAAAVRERGLDHTLLLSRQAARQLRREFGLALPVRRLVRPPRRALDQVGLDAGARRENRRHHFTAETGAGEVPILIDDVTTTGSTLAAAATALADAGSPVLGAAVVAATVLRHRPAA